MKHSTKELNVRYFMLQVLFWGAAVVYYAYMTQILEAKGFSEVEIGLLNGVRLLLGVIFQIWIGAFADKHIYTIPLKYLIGILSLATGIFTVGLVVVGHNFWVMFVISVGLGVAFTTLSPLIDSLSMLYVNHGVNVNYARGRMGGSISWAFLCIMAGIYCDRFGMKSFPVWGLLFIVILFFLACFMPWEKVNKSNALSVDSKKDNTPHSTVYLLKNYPVFTVFLVGSSIMFMGYNFGSTFLIDIFTGLGGNNTHYGLGEFVLAISEVPSALIILKMRNVIPMRWMMVCCSVFMTIKNLIPTYATSIPVVIAAQSCEMLGLGLFYAGSIFFVEENLPREDIVKGTTLISVATVGMGEGIAALLCGIIRKHFGLYGLMKTGTLTNAFSIIFFLMVCRMSAKKKEKVSMEIG